MKYGPQIFSYHKLPGSDSFEETTPLLSVLNKTKWDELRAAMLDLGDISPNFRCMSLGGYCSPPDGEWFYHFSEGGHENTHFVDLILLEPRTREAVRSALSVINLPGEETAEGFRIYGYAREGQVLGYIK